MPLTAKGKKIMGSMKEQYGDEKGERVFYASKNKGTIKGVDKEAYAKGFNEACRLRGVDPGTLRNT